MRCEIKLENSRLFVKTPYAPALIERFHTIPGAKFHPGDKRWSFHAVKDVALMVCDAVGVLPWMLDADVKQLCGKNGVQSVNHVALDMSVLEGHSFTTQPYEHQRQNLARLIQNPRWLIADEQGTGKTHAVVNRLGRALGYDLHYPRLIICPKSVISVWLSELDKHGSIKTVFVVNGDRDYVSPGAIAVLTNYERVLHSSRLFTQIKWGTIVLDEIHRIKSFTGKTARIIRQLTARANYVYGLSGTPAPNGLEDWFGVLSAIKPDILIDDFGNPITTKAGFEARYCIKSRIGESNVWKVSGYRNVAELHDRISSVTSRVTKAECLDLPEKVFCTRTVTLAGEQARVYGELKKEAVARLTQLGKEGECPYCGSDLCAQMASDGAMICSVSGKAFGPNKAMYGRDFRSNPTLTVNNVLSESLRLLQVVGGFVPDDSGALHDFPTKAKMTALAEVIEEVGDKQVVIWCAFKPEVAYLTKWCVDHFGGDPSVLTGDTPLVERAYSVERFQKGDSRFFIGTSAAGGTGITLHAADTEIYYSRNWNLADYLQSQDRLHRIGQKNTVSVIKLIAHGTVDAKVDEALERKTSLQEMMLRNPEELF